MIVSLAIALALQILPAPGALAWEAVAEEADGFSFVAPASIAREGDIVRFLLRLDSRTPRADGTTRFVMRAAIDCRALTMGYQTGDAYGAGGAFLRSRDEPVGAIRYEPLGDSLALAALHARVCR
jgi:hypothetical protein